jgi:TonB family protein
MGRVVAKLFHEPFGLNHAAIISIAIHAMFLYVQPFDFLNKSPVLEKKYKEVRLDFIRKTRVNTPRKNIVNVMKPFLSNRNNVILHKPTPPPVRIPVRVISRQPLSKTPKIVSIVNRASQVTLPNLFAIQKFYPGKSISKQLIKNDNVYAKSMKTSEVFNELKTSLAKNIDFSGSKNLFSVKQFKPRTTKRGGHENFDAKGISPTNLVMTKKVVELSFKHQARYMSKFTPDLTEDPLSTEELKKLWAGYTSAVRKMIAKAKIYPSAARDKGQQGKTDLSFKLGKHGELLKLLIENSSGNNTLDDAARDAVKNAGPFPPIPEKLNKQYVLLELPVSFILR